MRTLAVAVVLFALAVGGGFLYMNSKTAVLTTIPTIGIINPGGDAFTKFADGFLAGMAERGYREGENIHFEIRNAEGDGDLLPGFIDEFVSADVDALILMAGPSTRYALEQTQTIPILTIIGSPVHHGYAESLESSGKNLTGIAHTNIELTTKRIELVKEALPEVEKIAVFYDTTCGPTKAFRPLGQQVAEEVGVQLTEFALTQPTEEEVSSALDSALGGEEEFDAVLFYPHSTLFKQWDTFAQKAKEYGLPIMAPEESNISEGRAFASYGADYFEAGKQLSRQTHKILSGVPASDIPFETSRSITYVINTKNVEDISLELSQDALRQSDKTVSQ